MATVNSNNYKIAIVKETSRGAQVKNLTTGGGVFFADKLTWNNEPITVDLEKKNNSLYENEDRTLIVGEHVTGTLSGALTDMHEILLQAHFDDSASPYLYAAAMPTAFTYNVYQLYLDSTGACTSYDVLLGCIINPLSITGKPNDILQYSATIDATSYLQNVANSSGTALTLAAGIPVTGTPFLFGDVTASMIFGETELLSLNLELSKTLVDNDMRFQNSKTKTNDDYIGVGGTLSYDVKWEAQNEKACMYNQTSQYCSLDFINASKTWTISFNGVLTQADRPDADRGLFVGTYAMRLTSNASADPPVIITVISV